MRDLRLDEIGQVYGAGGRGSCRPKHHNPCRGRGTGTRGKGTRGKGTGTRGRKNRCKGSNT